MGRRWLAAADAPAWPLLWVLALRHFPAPMGIVAPMVISLAVLFAGSRLRRALWANHRYRFTTWCWGSAIAVVVGAVLKLDMST